MKNDRKWLWAYEIIGALTFLFQVLIRLQQCDGITRCGLSLAKAVIWSVVWPA